MLISTGCRLDTTNGNGNGGTSDTTPPAISDVVASSITTDGATVTWTTDEAADSQVEYGTTDAYGTTSDLVTALAISHAVTLSGLAPNTTYHFRVRSGDGAGNQTISDDYTFTTLELDTESPTISGITAASTSETSATVTWITDEPASSKLEYGTTVGYGQIKQESALKTDHSVTITDLAADTTYHFRVASSDGEDNEAMSGDGTFTTLAVDPGGLATAAVADEIVDLINAERISRELTALTRSEALDTLANEYAANQFLLENDLTYLVYNAWQLTFSLGSPRFDEDTAVEQVDYCMNQPDMRDALLGAEAAETGVGVATIDNAIYFTQVFDVVHANGGDGEPIVLVENPTATDPTWEQLEAFLISDATDEIPYVTGSFICGDFAEALHNNAEAAGIRAAYVSVRLTEEPGHALNAFNVDGTTVFIDVGSADKVAYLKIGKDYGAIVLGAIALGTSEEFTYTYFEAYLESFEDYLAAVDDYSAAVAAYNAEVISYNEGDPVPDQYADEDEWRDALEARQAELSAWSADLEDEKTALGIGDTYFHPTEALAVDDPTVVDYYIHW